MLMQAGTEQFGLGDDDEVGSEGSVHTAASNESDLEGDDDDADYLALELVSHLPPDKASRLMKGFRAKERMLEDLVSRNRGLLSTCNRLDEENATLSERLREAESADAEAAQAAAAAAPASPAPAPAGVDNSMFLKMER